MPFITYYGYCHSLDGATLFSKVDSNKLRINVKNKMTLIDAKFHADLINISEVTSRKTKWPRFFGLPCSSVFASFPPGKVNFPGPILAARLVKVVGSVES